jgi:NADP-dependent 3-hydroxy acid dehydrogenase YdfG
MSDIHNSLFIITGAGSGIGRALAIQSAEAGAHVIATDVNESRVKETATRCKGKVETYVLDVSKPEHIESFASAMLKKYPEERIILVNNAGVSLGMGTFAETILEDFEWLLSINLWGVVQMTHAFLPHMLKQDKGHIVNVSSSFGLAGMPHNSAYCTAKFGVKGFSDVLKAELLRTNVKVSSVHPGGVKTNIARDGRISKNQNEAEAKKLALKFEEVALKMPPEKAASSILNGIQKDHTRILVGNDAKMMDTIVRMFPDSYHKIFSKLFKL